MSILARASSSPSTSGPLASRPDSPRAAIRSGPGSMDGTNGRISLPPAKRPRIVKFILLGDTSVGKTSLLHRFCEGRFQRIPPATIGVEFKWREIAVPTGSGASETVRLHVWDTCGQEQYRVISKPYYRQADGAVLVYDKSSAASLDALAEFVAQARELCPLGVTMVLLGNKCDLVDQEEVTKEDGERFARRNGIPLFFETSASLGTHVDDAFGVLCRHVVSMQTSATAIATTRVCGCCRERDAVTMCLVCSGYFCADCQVIPHDENEDGPGLVHRDFRELPRYTPSSTLSSSDSGGSTPADCKAQNGKGVAVRLGGKGDVKKPGKASAALQRLRKMPCCSRQ